MRACLAGAGLAGATSALTWAGAGLLGWITVVRVDVGALMVFLVVNTVVLTSYEALPEELSLRGYAWTNLRDGWGPAVATVVVTTLFALNSAPMSLLRRIWAILLGNETEPIALAPYGTPTFFYIIHLTCFGLVLIAARRLPITGALAAPMSFHLVYLTANRIIMGGFSWLGSGVEVEFDSPDTAVLVLAPLALSGPAFILLRKWLEARAADQGADNLR
jgi:putative membrane protein